jgi:hypothetical protein
VTPLPDAALRCIFPPRLAYYWELGLLHSIGTLPLAARCEVKNH